MKVTRQTYSASKYPMPVPVLICSIEIRIFRRANKYRLRDVRNWSKDQWLDKGMATMIFTVHTDLQGCLAGDV